MVLWDLYGEVTPTGASWETLMDGSSTEKKLKHGKAI